MVCIWQLQIVIIFLLLCYQWNVFQVKEKNYADEHNLAVGVAMVITVLQTLYRSLFELYFDSILKL